MMYQKITRDGRLLLPILESGKLFQRCLKRLHPFVRVLVVKKDDHTQGVQPPSPHARRGASLSHVQKLTKWVSGG